MWTRILRSSLLRGLESQLVYYFYVLIAVLILLFLDSIREMEKYSSEELQYRKVGLSHLDTQMQMQMRLFRAQRNYYIAGWVAKPQTELLFISFYSGLPSSFSWSLRNSPHSSQPMPGFR